MPQSQANEKERGSGCVFERAEEQCLECMCCCTQIMQHLHLCMTADAPICCSCVDPVGPHLIQTLAIVLLSGLCCAKATPHLGPIATSYRVSANHLAAAAHQRQVPLLQILPGGAWHRQMEVPSTSCYSSDEPGQVSLYIHMRRTCGLLSSVTIVLLVRRCTVSFVSPQTSHLPQVLSPSVQFSDQ